MTAVRDVRRRFSWGLLYWSVGSVAVGLPLWLLQTDRPFLGPVWAHFWIWGAIDLLFAIPGVLQARRADRAPRPDRPLPPDEHPELADAHQLLRTLQFSHKLNWLWVGTAAALLLSAAVVASLPLAGHGTGVLIQGGFLFLFDRRFDRALRDALRDALQRTTTPPAAATSA